MGKGAPTAGDGIEVKTDAYPGDGQLSIAERLAGRHFTMRHVGTDDLRDVEIIALDPSLRGLLFTDGTVTRALEVQTLSRVVVHLVDQSLVPLPAQTAHHLEVKEAVECLRRRVTMTMATVGLTPSIVDATPSVWAESYIVSDRLPSDFPGLLDSTPRAIGGALQRLKLESRRELLWFGLGESPCWENTVEPSGTALIRVYRIMTNGLPALLISEAFGVEMHEGLYRPAGWTGPAVIE